MLRNLQIWGPIRPFYAPTDQRPSRAAITDPPDPSRICAARLAGRLCSSTQRRYGAGYRPPTVGTLAKALGSGFDWGRRGWKPLSMSLPHSPLGELTRARLINRPLSASAYRPFINRTHSGETEGTAERGQIGLRPNVLRNMTGMVRVKAPTSEGVCEEHAKS